MEKIKEIKIARKIQLKLFIIECLMSALAITYFYYFFSKIG